MYIEHYICYLWYNDNLLKWEVKADPITLEHKDKFGQRSRNNILHVTEFYFSVFNLLTFPFGTYQIIKLMKNNNIMLP